MDRNAMRERLEREPADLVSTTERIKERLAVPQREKGGDIALAEARIGLIEALRRLERGEYAKCVICGRDMPEERLDLVPETPFCIEDAEREQQSSTR